MNPESKKVDITIAGSRYSLRTEHEDVLKKAAGILEEKVRETRSSSEVVNTHREVIMAGLKIAVANVEMSDILAKAEAELDRLNSRLNEIDI
jgi:cell division protein ZapA (FtsZ GTPase activity inhibitor)